uniref:DOMON domain-containing protein n=1 Tax=Caenorhabditis japonica TaxID=281687 RepID=A0A8R1EMH9_CAEJA
MHLSIVSTFAISIVLCTLFQEVDSKVCSFENELIATSWNVKNGETKILEIRFEHKNFTENRWTSLAFGNGPGMNNLEAIIFSRGDDDTITTYTAFTPKKKKVDVDDVAYVNVENSSVNGNHLKITVTRPLGSVGPRNHSLEKCVNWIVIPGGTLKSKGHFKKHHGGVEIVKNVCAAQCTSDIGKMVLTNRIH